MVGNTGKIERRIMVKGDKGSATVTALFDSGSAKTFIRQDVADRLCTIQFHDMPIKITLADGHTTVNEIGLCVIKMEIEDHILDDVFHVLDINDGKDLFIGVQTLQKFNLHLFFGKSPKDDSIDFSQFREELNELF